MNARFSSLCVAMLTAVVVTACSAASTPLQPSATISTPAPLQPGDATQFADAAQPVTLVVKNAVPTKVAGATTYVFEVATDAAFVNKVQIKDGVAEGSADQTGVKLDALPAGNDFFWHARASNGGVVSGYSTTFRFTVSAAPGLSQAERVSAQLGVALWPGQQPPGTTGHATMGENWEVQTLHYLPENAFFQSPDLEMLRFFDLFDHGIAPDAAADWMNSHGYPTLGLWYPPPEKAVLGLHYVYLASVDKVLTNATWNIVLRVE